MKNVKHFLLFLNVLFLIYTLVSPKTVAAEEIVIPFNNGGFETADFTGWSFGDNGIPAGIPWYVSSEWESDNFPISPIEGAFDAVNGFDGEAGHESYLYQDIVVPLEATTLSLSDHIIYDGYSIPSTLPRIYEVQVRDLNNQLLEVLHHQEIMLNDQPYTDLGWQLRNFDLSAYSGQLVRIYINLFVPESFTGPAQIEFDNFVFTNQIVSPPPIFYPLNNGGFETGDFTGWNVGDNGMYGESWFVSLALENPEFPVQPIEGIFDAVNFFDGEAGYETFLFQDAIVPSDATILSFSDHIIYDSISIPSTLPRIYEVQLRDTNNQLLEVLHHQEIMLNNQPYTDLGWQLRNFDLSAYSGQPVRIYINLYVPETYTGPAQIEFDNFGFGNTSVSPLDYCVSQGLDTSYEWIDSIQMNDYQNFSGNNDGYGDFSGQVIDLYLGENNITLTPGYNDVVYPENWRIWIDFNHDLIFDQEELVYEASQEEGIWDIMSIPSNALTGPTRMRISMEFGEWHDACEDIAYGEVEDYTVYIHPAP